MKERQRVLSAIENDKRSKKKCSTATAHDASNTGNETEHPSGSKGESPEKKNNCRIQVSRKIFYLSFIMANNRFFP